MKKWQANICLLLVSMLWGMGFIASDIAIETLSPFATQFMRFGIGSLILFVLFTRKLLKINKETLIAGSLLAIIFYFSMSVQLLALKQTTISKNAFFTITSVVFVPLILLIVTGKRIEKKTIIGLALMIIGFMFLIFQLDPLNLVQSLSSISIIDSFNQGDLLTLIAAFGFAIHIILTTKYAIKYDLIQLLFLQLFISTLLSIILMFVIDGSLPVLTTKSLIAIIFLGVFNSVLAFGLQLVGQKYTDSTKAVILLSTEAAFATLFSVLLGREDFFIGLVIGGLLIFIGVVISEYEQVKP